MESTRLGRGRSDYNRCKSTSVIAVASRPKEPVRTGVRSGGIRDGQSEELALFQHPTSPR
jgi:hypothetical protein